MKKGNSYFEDVYLWNDAFGFYLRGKPPHTYSEKQQKQFEFAFKLVEEEYDELKEAFEEKDLFKIADGCADLIWVVCGLMARMGMDLDAAWDEVRRTNWAKEGGPRRQTDGKLLKPEGWKPPDMMAAMIGRDLLKLVGKEQALECDVCGEEAVGVCASPLGPVSHAFCAECVSVCRQPWSTLVGGLYGAGPDDVADWVKPYIEATCAFYNKTEDQLWQDVAELEQEYEQACNSLEE